MKLTRITGNFVFVLTALIAAANASAELQISRDVTVTDGLGGSMTLVTVGTHDVIGAESTTTATFSNFRPSPEGKTHNGEVVRERVRSEGMLESVFDGVLEISFPARNAKDQPAQTATLVFEALSVIRDGDGPILSGTVIFNGEPLDAADLPRAAARILARALRFFAYA